MTVSVTDAFSGPFTGNGSTKAFPFGFDARSPAEVEVRVNGIVQMSGYDASVSSGVGGTVTFGTAPANGAEILIISSPSFTQETSFEDAGQFLPSTHDAVNDQAARRDIYLKDQTDRALKAPPGESLGELPSVRAGLFAAFDADGNITTSTGTGGDASLRADLAASSGSSLISYIPATGLTAMSLQTALRLGLPLMPDHFGAVGDGATDDYLAFQALATKVNGNGGGKIAFRQGATYKIDRYIVAGNGVTDITFTTCVGLEIIGNGAKIDYKGNFDRNVSTTRGLSGFVLDRCTDVVISNLELDGNVDQMTNSSGSSESPTHGFRINGCLGLKMLHVDAHHFSADGLQIDYGSTGSPRPASKRIWLANCSFKFNARCGISPIQVRGLIADNCDFSYQGLNDEAGSPYPAGYTPHSPVCGWDIEPNNTPTHGTLVDVKTGDILFRNCRALGTKVLCSKYANGEYYQEDVRYENSTFVCSDGTAGGADGFIFECPNGFILGGSIDVRDRTAYVGYNATGDAIIKVLGTTFKGRSNSITGIVNARTMAGGRVLFDDCDFIATHTTAKSAQWFFDFLNPYSDVYNSRFFLPAAGYTDATGTDLMRAIRFNGKRVQDCRFETDLLASAGSSGTAHYGVMFGDTTIARGNRYAGVAQGWADTIRPGRDATSTIFTWDSNFLFGTNMRMNVKTSHDWPSLATGSQQSTTLTVADASIGDAVSVGMSIALNGTSLRGEVTAADTVTVYQSNGTGGAVDLAAGDIYATVTRRAQ